MNLDSLLPLLITTVVAIVGWYFAHRMSAARDRANKKRDLRVQYLIDAYRRLEAACVRDDVMPYKEDIEKSIADVQLFGTDRQINLVKQIIKGVEEASYSDPRPLLANLRDDLRNELNLEREESMILHFRVSGNAPKKT